MYDMYNNNNNNNNNNNGGDGGDDGLRWVKVRVRVVNLLNMPETMQSPISETNP